MTPDDMATDEAMSPGVRAARRRMAEDESRLRLDVINGLHDGVQQYLVMLLIALRLARQALDTRSEGVTELLDEATDQAELALADVRALVARVLPFILTTRGLASAVRALGEGAPFPVKVLGTEDRRFDPSLEMHAYFVVAQALTSAIEQQASSVRVAIEESAGLLAVVVSQEGGRQVGPEDVYLVRIADRISALDGQFGWSSGAGGASTIRVTIPLPSDPE